MTAESMQEKIALVTGAGSGIGQATVAKLAELGAVAYGADLSNSADQQDTGSAFVKLDVTSEEDWQAAVAQIRAEHGRLDILVNCAGIASPAPITEMSLSTWRKVMAVNLDGVFLGTKHAIPLMREHGGAIVNVSSASGIKAAPGDCAYSTSKSAVCMFTKATAKECTADKIPVRSNCICPGGVRTPMWNTMAFFQECVKEAGSPDAALDQLAAGVPGERFAEPVEIADAILFLASEGAKYVNGAVFVMDGGYVL